MEALVRARGRGIQPGLAVNHSRAQAALTASSQVGSLSDSTRLRPSPTISPVLLSTTTAPKQPPAGSQCSDDRLHSQHCCCRHHCHSNVSEPQGWASGGGGGSGSCGGGIAPVASGTVTALPHEATLLITLQTPGPRTRPLRNAAFTGERDRPLHICLVLSLANWHCAEIFTSAPQPPPGLSVRCRKVETLATTSKMSGKADAITLQAASVQVLAACCATRRRPRHAPPTSKVGAAPNQGQEGSGALHCGVCCVTESLKWAGECSVLRDRVAW